MAMDQTKIYEADQPIFAEGSPGDLMYVLLEGEVQLRKRVGKGETVLKTVASPNDFFGEMALIDGRPRSASAIAIRRSKLLVVDGPTFENMILTNGKFALKIIKVLSDRIRNTNTALEELHELAPRDRFVKGMVEYAQVQGEKIFDGRIRISLAGLQVWARERMGFPPADAEAHISRLLKGGLLAPSPAKDGQGEGLLISEQLFAEFGRREVPGAEARDPLRT
jgi:CRP-like cAMP-binding protein